ncbi:hypothetical protein ACS0PU_000952 [Formica fusca]
MKILHVILLIAVAIIMISDSMAEETSSKEASSKNPLGFRPSTQRRLKNLCQHMLDEIIITLLNIVFNVGWEETYDYLFGNYGMQPIPYFPIP